MAGMKQNMRGSKAVLAAVRSRSRSSLSWIGHPVRRLISMMRQLLLPLRRAQTHLREPKLTHFSSDRALQRSTSSGYLAPDFPFVLSALAQ